MVNGAEGAQQGESALGCEAWQLLGRSLGTNPTPMAYAEVYTGLQTGAVDGQDNPLPNVQDMKFFEVMSQIVLTAHLVAFDLLSMNLKIWNALSPAQQAKVQAAADQAISWSTAQHVQREEQLATSFREQGLDVYKADVDAFRRRAQAMYLQSDRAKDWPAGLIDKINAMWPSAPRRSAGRAPGRPARAAFGVPPASRGSRRRLALT